MNATKHTPGPWKVGRTVGGLLVVQPVDKRRGTVASLTDESALVNGEWAQRDYTNAEANGRLIAAAPDLLAALRALLPYALSRAEDLQAAKDAGNEDPAYPGADAACAAVESASALLAQFEPAQVTK